MPSSLYADTPPHAHKLNSSILFYLQVLSSSADLKKKTRPDLVGMFLHQHMT